MTLAERARMLIALAEMDSPAVPRNPARVSSNLRPNRGPVVSPAADTPAPTSSNPERAAPRFLELLVCPVTKTSLAGRREEPGPDRRAARLAYPIRMACRTCYRRKPGGSTDPHAMEVIDYRSRNQPPEPAKSSRHEPMLIDGAWTDGSTREGSPSSTPATASRSPASRAAAPRYRRHRQSRDSHISASSRVAPRDRGRVLTRIARGGRVAFEDADPDHRRDRRRRLPKPRARPESQGAS